MSQRTEHDLANELYERRRAPGEWSEEAEVIDARPSRSAVVSVRVPIDEFAALATAAKASGLTLSEYVRSAIAARRQGVVPQQSIETSSSGTHVHVTSSLPPSSAWTEAPRSQDRLIVPEQVRTAA